MLKNNYSILLYPSYVPDTQIIDRMQHSVEIRYQVFNKLFNIFVQASYKFWNVPCYVLSDVFISPGEKVLYLSVLILNPSDFCFRN